MKTIWLTRVTAVMLVAGAVACNTDNITAANRNPNNPTDAPAGALFTAATASSVGRWLGGYDFGQVEILVQQLAETTYPQEDEYVNLQADRTSTWFDASYTTDLVNFRKVALEGSGSGAGRSVRSRDGDADVGVRLPDGYLRERTVFTGGKG